MKANIGTHETFNLLFFNFIWAYLKHPNSRKLLFRVERHDLWPRPFREKLMENKTFSNYFRRAQITSSTSRNFNLTELLATPSLRFKKHFLSLWTLEAENAAVKFYSSSREHYSGVFPICLINNCRHALSLNCETFLWHEISPFLPFAVNIVEVYE